MSVSFSEIQAAHERIRPFVIKTPVLTSSTFDQRFGCRAFFKAENLQRAGAFKMRGATNALLQLTPEQRQRGVLTFSSGNHAQALALAGKVHGCPVTVVMPHDAPELKKRATMGYGAEVVLYHREEESREELGRTLAEQKGLTLIPPYEHPWIIAGAGTAAKELCEEVPELDLVLVPCGGGGLLAGSSLSVKALQPSAKVYGVEPAAGDDGCRSFATGSIQTVSNPDTIADGARTPYLGGMNFEVIRRCVEGMVSVPDEALWEAMYYLWIRLKVMVEPTGALGAAALWEGKVKASGLRVGIIVSGGNCDPAAVLAWGSARNLLK